MNLEHFLIKALQTTYPVFFYLFSCTLELMLMLFLLVEFFLFIISLDYINLDKNRFYYKLLNYRNYHYVLHLCSLHLHPIFTGNYHYILHLCSLHLHPIFTGNYHYILHLCSLHLHPIFTGNYHYVLQMSTMRDLKKGIQNHC